VLRLARLCIVVCYELAFVLSDANLYAPIFIFKKRRNLHFFFEQAKMEYIYIKEQATPSGAEKHYKSLQESPGK
jgi:hypothetical protein